MLLISSVGTAQAFLQLGCDILVGNTRHPGYPWGVREGVEVMAVRGGDDVRGILQ